MSTHRGIVIVGRFVTVIISMRSSLFITDMHIIINAVNLSLVVSMSRRALSTYTGVIIINVVYLADSSYALVMVTASIIIARCVPGVGQIKIRR